jgi:hypothetical protein
MGDEGLALSPKSLANASNSMPDGVYPALGTEKPASTPWRHPLRTPNCVRRALAESAGRDRAASWRWSDANERSGI